MKESLRRIVLYTSLTLSTIIAAFMLMFRFCFLNEPPIYDEIYSLATAAPSIPFSTAWHHVLMQDVNLPLYNLLLRAWAAVVPFTVPWMRVLSALFSLAVVPAAWFCAPAHWPKLKKFILCALLAGSLPLTISGSLLRSYPIGIFTLTITLLFGLRILHTLTHLQKVPCVYWGVFFVGGFVTAYLHYFGAAIFFSTALWIFLATLRYKKYRLFVFSATALAFFMWIPWVLHSYFLMNRTHTQWWYETTAAYSSWKIMEYLWGNPLMAGGIFCFCVLGIVSLFFSAPAVKKETPLAEILLPLFCLVLLVGVVSLLSPWCNLWLDRYFLFCLPPLFIFLSTLLYHLYQRHAELIVLLPFVLGVWVFLLCTHFWPDMQDLSGLRATMEYLSSKNTPRVLVAYDQVSYAPPAQQFLLSFYAPKNIQLIPLTQENTDLLHQMPLVVPLCSFINLMNISYFYNFDVPEPVIPFQETCVVEFPHEE